MGISATEPKMSQCPFRDRVDEYLLGRLGEAETEGLEAHLFECDDCFQAAGGGEAVLAAVRRHGGRIFGPAAETVPLRPKRRAWRAWPFAAAAAAALLLAVWIGLGPRRPGSGMPSYGPPTEESVRGGSLEGITPVGPLADAPSVLEWKPVGAAGDYTVILTGPGLNWSARAAAARIEIPPDVRAKMVRGGSYRWKVKAFASQGGLLAVSAEAAFRIAD